MDSRNPDNTPPNHTDLWKLTDKKKPELSPIFWTQEKADKPMANAAANAAANAKGAAYVTLPLLTASGIALLGQKGGYINLAPLGLPLAIGGFVLDVVKAPVCVAVATEESIRAGIMKVSSLVFEQNPTQQEIDRIFNSFLIRMRETATLLIVLGLEESDVLDRKLRTGDIEDLVGLTLLHTAYASRNYHSGLVLATNKTLSRDDCPAQGLSLFDKIVDLKKSIESALNLADDNLPRYRNKDERELEESRIVCQWIRLVKAGKQLTIADKPDATTAQLAVVNQIITQIEDLKHRGINALPEAPAAVASHLPRPGRM